MSIAGPVVDRPRSLRANQPHHPGGKGLDRARLIDVLAELRCKHAEDDAAFRRAAVATLQTALEKGAR